ncbi:MAG: helix-turn-helix domain-containing protein, partial [Sedimentisphaerales bacterium]|nr:helix-turn-helix domain-containing protein [Sedimentisphaerales bacterium]
MADDENNRISGERLAEVLERLEEHLSSMRSDQVKSPHDWLTIEEVAEELRLSRDSIERLVGSGQMKSAIIDTPRGKGQRTCFRIRREWIDEFMQTSVRPFQLPVRSSNHRGSIRPRLHFS